MKSDSLPCWKANRAASSETSSGDLESVHVFILQASLPSQPHWTLFAKTAGLLLQSLVLWSANAYATRDKSKIFIAAGLPLNFDSSIFDYASFFQWTRKERRGSGSDNAGTLLQTCDLGFFLNIQHLSEKMIDRKGFWDLVFPNGFSWGFPTRNLQYVNQRTKFFPGLQQLAPTRLQ